MNLSMMGKGALLCALTVLPLLPAGAADARAEPRPPPAAPAHGAPFAAARALGDGALAAMRGGADMPWSDMKLNATVGGNSANAVVTGTNIVTEGAFSNAAGLPMVIQNSGANVLIQNATIVNVQFR